MVGVGSRCVREEEVAPGTGVGLDRSADWSLSDLVPRAPFLDLTSCSRMSLTLSMQRSTIALKASVSRLWSRIQLEMTCCWKAIAASSPRRVVELASTGLEGGVLASLVFAVGIDFDVAVAVTRWESG